MCDKVLYCSLYFVHMYAVNIYDLRCVCCAVCRLYIMCAVRYVLYMCLVRMKRVMCIVCCMYCALAA